MCLCDEAGPDERLGCNLLNSLLVKVNVEVELQESRDMKYQLQAENDSFYNHPKDTAKEAIRYWPRADCNTDVL